MPQKHAENPQENIPRESVAPLLKSHPYLQIHSIPLDHAFIRTPPGDHFCNNDELNGLNQNDLPKSCPKRPPIHNNTVKYNSLSEFPAPFKRKST